MKVNKLCKRIIPLLLIIIMVFQQIPAVEVAAANKVVQVGTMKLEFQGKDTVVLKQVVDKSNGTARTVTYDAIKKIVVAEGVKILPGDMFHRFPNVETISLPASLTSFESGNSYEEWQYMYYQSYNDAPLQKLKSITVSSKNKIYKSIDGVLYSKDGKNILHYPIAKTNKSYKVPESVDYVSISNKYIKELTIGTKVTYVGISRLPSLTKITVDSKNKKFTSVNGVLFSKDKKTLLLYPAQKGKNYTVPTGTIRIDDGAFFKSNITKIQLPTSLQEIGAKAFSETKLKSLTIPSQVKKIEYAFTDSSITHVYVDKGNKNFSSENGIVYNKNKTKMILWPEARAEKNLVFPNSLTELDLSMILKLEESNYLFIPDSLETITNTQKNQLSTLNISEQNNNFKIKDGVLYSKDLTEIKLYPNQNTITNIVIPDTVKELDYNMFILDNTTTSIKLPKGLVSIRSTEAYKYNSLGFNNLKEVLISEENENFTSVDGILYTKNMATLQWYPQNHKNTEYTIPNTVTSAEYMQLIHTKNLVELNIPASFSINRLMEAIFEEFHHVQYVPGFLSPMLERINVDDGNEYLKSEDGVLYDKNTAMLLLYPSAKKNKKFEVPQSVSAMNSYSYNPYLEELVLPNNLYKLFEYDSNMFTNSYDAFVYFTGLKKFSITAGESRMKVIDGGLYYLEQLIAYPIAREESTFRIATDTISMYCLQNLKYAKNLKTLDASGSKYYKAKGGNLYTYYGELILTVGSEKNQLTKDIAKMMKMN